MTAAELVAALGGRWLGHNGTAKCPAHEDRTPSLGVTEGSGGKVLVRCFAGCDQARVIDALRARDLWGGVSSEMEPIVSAEERARREADRQADRKRRTELALRIWREGRPAAGSPVELYLRNRGITIAPPVSLRYHPGLRHQPTGLDLPAMVAAVQAAGREIVGVHRTFIRDDGKGKAPVSTNKMALGPIAGGAVRLAAPSPTLAIGEGIETCLAAMQATGIAAWAALGTSGLRGLVLPEEVDTIVILADGDTAGADAALAAAARWEREARTVRIARPPHGTDFNDVLRAAS